MQYIGRLINRGIVIVVTVEMMISLNRCASRETCMFKGLSGGEALWVSFGNVQPRVDH